MSDYSLYLHIPFCQHRCSYCDFNTYAGLEKLIPDYVRALCREIEFSAESLCTHPRVQTIFFGGGTPSLLPIPEMEKVLKTIQRNFELRNDLELTLEANPGTLSLDYLCHLRALGVNRLSLGMQSANTEELGLLERQHNVEDVILAVKWARQAGFDNLNLDLIFGLPYQEMGTWQRTLNFALNLNPDHFSLYALTLEHGTPMQHWTQRGLLPEADPDLAAEMYEWASERLAVAGYAHYEISNWGKRRSNGEIMACRHNLQYWRSLPYLGYGAGAHGFVNHVRIANVLPPAVYIRRLSESNTVKYGHRNAASSLGNISFPRTPATANYQPLARETEIGETMMMGLRLTDEGVSAIEFQRRFGRELKAVYEKEIHELIELGLLEWAGKDGDCLRLTPHGHLLGNQVFMRFI
jgi:oxygen-independent coproporphyrinogen-3 oxidase